MAESIPEREYGLVEFHANFFAGLVLIPPRDLSQEFSECIIRAKQQGLDVLDEVTGARDIIESYIGRRFKVSRDVVHRRLEADRLWETMA